MRSSSLALQMVSTPISSSSKFAPSPLARLIRTHIISSPSSSLSSPSTPSTPSGSSPDLQPGPITLRIPNPFANNRLSLRTQSDLVKTYPSTWLPPSLKNPEGSAVVDYEADGIRVHWTGGNFADLKGKGVRPGERKTFKGNKVDRVAKARREESKVRMEGMDKRIEDWKQTKRDVKQNLKSSLPF